MLEAPKILYFDLELDAKDRIAQVGAVLGKRELHERNTQRLESWVQEADYVCGHNVVAYDLPVLRKHLGTDPFAGKPVIDTLLWSPLLFPVSPYHKLVKGYQLVNEDTPNDPLADSKLCKELLQEEVVAFEALDLPLKAIYHALLGERPGYEGLFQLTGTIASPGHDLEERIRSYFQDRLCATVDLQPFIQEYPVELAYALALITTTSTVSILPEYVVLQFPRTCGVLEQLRFSACTDPACGYCANNLDPRKALGQRFGHANFRLFRGEVAPGVQERAVRSAVMGESLLAVFPTGGGKSITFQLPALMRGELTRDLTVVISPLVSLMKDQVDVLTSRHGVVHAAYISSLLSPLERDEALENVRSGAVHLLYLSPESLRSPTIFRLLCGRNIARFVIDEAHCFSSWGQDFRVDYLYIAEFIKTLQQEKGMLRALPISCFTATAKPQVVEDIRTYFKERMGLELELFVTRAPRENLSYEVVAVEDPDQKPAKLVEILKENEGPAIVYVSRTKRVRELVEHLGKSGFRATGFHGQMERDEKQRNQKAFMNDEVDVMVATSAFGMGVDKEDVKTVVHYNISDSLESYIQEAGRAGRRSDIEAKCFVLYHENDLANHFRMHQSAKLNLKQIDQVWRAIKNLTKVRSSINKSALEIAKEAGWDVEMKDLENKLKSAVAALEDRGYLARKLNYTAVKATSLLVRNVNEAVKRIKASEQLSESQKLDCTRMVQRIVKDKDQTGETRIDYLADVLQMHVGKAQETIDRLREVGILADGKDLTAVVDRSPRSKRASHIRARDVMEVEKALLGLFSEEPVQVSLKELNQRLLDKGIKGTSTEIIHSLLLFWELRRIVTKKRVKRQEEVYAIRFKKPPSEVLEHMELRHALAAECLGYLESLADAAKATPQGTPITFSLLELKKQVEFKMLGAAQDLKDIEGALLFLNQLKAIQLQGGFMVYFQRLHIERKEQNNRKQFTQEDYEKLLRFYTNKVEQIHIVGEYARKRIASYTEALAFVDDYFKLGYEAFVRKYFPNRRTEITRTMTETRFKELFGHLSLDQRAVVNDKADHILVSAGPGSGKTMVLVHKIASLLLMEDIKPEQFLMLTFSKSAALEFRSRVHKLVPEYRGLLKIFTFHGFCFDLLGEIGDLERSEKVIAMAIEKLEDKDNDDQLSTVLNKSVLVLDEFQDVTAEEWRLIHTLADRIPNLRIVAVGDDDQNIYEWRGASHAHWHAFIRRFAPKEHALLTNYRSAPNIVAFNNHIAEGITERSKKKEQVIEASSKIDGSIMIHEHVSSHLVEPLVKDLVEHRTSGTTAVLARTNEDVLLLSAALAKAGIKVRTVHGAEGFRLDMLHEIRQFTDLQDTAQTSLGSVSRESWQRMRDHFLQLLEEHPLKDDLTDIIGYFESKYPDRFELNDWREFTRDLRLEEAAMAAADTVLVTTMHKAKGKEFDKVFVLLKHDREINDSDRRLLYVACSRARTHLSIHVNAPVLRTMEVPSMQYIQDTTSYAAPDVLDCVAGLKDVVLNSMKFAQEEIKLVGSGAPLVVSSSFSTRANGPVLHFSAKMKERVLDKFAKAGYVPTEGLVEYKVHWYSKDDGREYEVILPRIRLRRMQ